MCDYHPFTHTHAIKKGFILEEKFIFNELTYYIYTYNVVTI